MTDGAIAATVECMVDVNDNDLLDLDEEDYDTVLAPDIDFEGTIEFAEPFMINRITSYNVCYTKLLRVDVYHAFYCSRDGPIGQDGRGKPASRG